MGKEQWKVIPGFDLYEVSNYGRVKCNGRSVKRGWGECIKPEHIMKPIANGNGYFRVCLSQHGKKERFYIHRLVADAFLPNEESKPFVNHIDNNPANNSVENLEWCTAKENVEWMIKQGRHTRTKEWLDHLHESMEKSYRPVIAKNIATGETLYFERMNEVKEKGFWPANVHRCCNGKAKQHKGYTWKYA